MVGNAGKLSLLKHPSRPRSGSLKGGGSSFLPSWLGMPWNEVPRLQPPLRSGCPAPGGVARLFPSPGTQKSHRGLAAPLAGEHLAIDPAWYNRIYPQELNN